MQVLFNFAYIVESLNMWHGKLCDVNNASVKNYVMCHTYRFMYLNDKSIFKYRDSFSMYLM